MKLILLGAPGSGKGTVSEQLIKDFRLQHISPGELLREEVKKNTTIGREIQKYIEAGKLVPDQFVVEMVKLEVKGKDNFILDGFPRTVSQAKSIDDLNIDSVIYLEVPEAVVIERFSGRRVCPQCNTGYHVKYLPPKKAGICDKDGTKLIIRKDDDPKVIKERFKVFHAETKPLIDYYTKQKKLRVVNGNDAPRSVYQAVKRLLNH